jgi:hypothetical protein
LVAIEDDTMRAEFRYDYTGRRVIKRVLWKPTPSPDTSPPPPDLVASSTWVLYPGRHFEVREHDEPTKYVFAGPTRIARITGSLSNQQRVQRIHCGLTIRVGWMKPIP